MKLQEEISVTAPAFNWVGAEVLSILQLLFFLVLGYAVTRTWMWSRSHSVKKMAKKLDDVDQMLEEIQGSESEATPISKSKTSNSNALERRNKKKKAKEVNVEKLQNELDPLPSIEPAPEKVCAQVSIEPAPEKVEYVEQPEEQLPEQRQAKEPEQEPEEEAPQELPEEKAQKAQMSAEKVAKMMAKKMERKAKKAAQEKVAAEKQITLVQENLNKEEKSHPVEGDRAETPQSDIEPIVEAKSDAEALSDDAQTASTTPSSITEAEVTDESSEEICTPVCTPEMCQRGEGIATPDECPSPRGANSEPSYEWCGLPQVPQMEGWVAVAVPAEFAPPGAPGPFDGLWENGEDERIIIDHDEIQFESGMTWVMQMHSLTNLSVQVGDEEFTAELDIATQHLIWSDGDTWKCVGQTEAQKSIAENLPCIFLEGDHFMQMNTMGMAPPMPPTTGPLIPEDAKEWEVCWDWSKKGYCPREGCDWYHPVQQQPAQFPGCMPCGPAPFSEFF